MQYVGSGRQEQTQQKTGIASMTPTQARMIAEKLGSPSEQIGNKTCAERNYDSRVYAMMREIMCKKDKVAGVCCLCGAKLPVAYTAIRAGEKGIEVRDAPPETKDSENAEKYLSRHDGGSEIVPHAWNVFRVSVCSEGATGDIYDDAKKRIKILETARAIIREEESEKQFSCDNNENGKTEYSRVTSAYF